MSKKRKLWCVFYRDDAVDLCILWFSSACGGWDERTAAWYEDEASCASAGTVPPANIVQKREVAFKIYCWHKTRDNIKCKDKFHSSRI